MKMKRLISFVIVLLLICGMPVSAFADTWYVDDGNITVNATDSGQTVSQGETTTPDDAPVITQRDSSTPTTNTVTINAAENAEANVTIQDVNIVISTSGGAAIQTEGKGDAVIELDGTNTVQSSSGNAGVQKTNGGNLTISDENGTAGSLKATGGFAGAGIGGGPAASVPGNNITITGGTIEAIGGDSGAGIGGGGGQSADGINITGGKVTATGKGNAAGIGGGAGGAGSNITISGGDVEATGGDRAAGIGGGGGGTGSNITITGSAEVTAKGGENGAGIGGGSGQSGSSITVSGGNVEATGGFSASGIGGGAGGSGEIITITGNAEVTAKGGLSGAGIGGGQDGSCSNITVSGDAQVKAQGGRARSYPSFTQYGLGAAIGNGGKINGVIGDEVTPNTKALNKGWIATYAPGTANLDTATPNSLTYKGAPNVTGAQPIVKLEPTCTETGHKAGFMIGNTQVGGQTLPATGHSFTNYVSDNNATYDHDGTKTAECDHCDATHTIPDPGSKLVPVDAPQPLYRVLGQDGKALSYKAEHKDGVLTITVDADFASLTGKLGGIQTLKAQGIDTIVFVTNGATSTFALSDLLAQGSTGDSYTLNHNGDTVSFTLGEAKTDINEILAQP